MYDNYFVVTKIFDFDFDNSRFSDDGWLIGADVNESAIVPAVHFVINKE